MGHIPVSYLPSNPINPSPTRQKSPQPHKNRKRTVTLTRKSNSFFAILNAIFLPILYFFYPETSGRTLEEIDLIFAKGHDEKISYVHAEQKLPKMTAAEIAAMAREYGVNSSDDEAGNMKKRRASERENKKSDEEKRASDNNQGGLMA